MRSRLEPTQVRIPISSLADSDTPRLSGEDIGHIRALAESDAPFPPIIVHRSTMRVIDGIHRLRATELRGKDTINVRYFDGNNEEAFVLAVKANVTHGLPLTSAERTAAIKRIIESYPRWSDRAIAAATGLSAKTVAAIRRCATEEGAQLHARIGRDGRARPLNPAEGRHRASQLMADDPNASLREVARAAGISPGTVRDVRARLRDGKDPIPPRQQSEIAPEGLASRHCGDIAVQRLVGNGALILGSLRRDPSLRFNEAGRVVLRLLDMHTMDAREWDRLADHVPIHCVHTVSAMARECASAWQEFAEQLDQRGHATG